LPLILMTVTVIPPIDGDGFTNLSG
jgi:hypothetical protein